MKVKKRMPVVIDEDVSESVVRFNRALNQLNEVLIDRQTEVDALKLAIATGSNLMLEGLPGTSKSMLANEFFNRIEGPDLVTFRKQLMKGTQPDELFGPMKSVKYREEAIWEHNIEGMLPTAHFAFIDEVYRGSDMLLPAILSILNEKKFMNGLQEVHCPLITAIGTTNFVTDNKELEAFHDRWLIKVKVSPLTSTTLRIKMLEQFLEQQRRPAPVHKVLLEDIVKIRRQVRRLTLDADAAELYEDVVSTYRKRANNPYISDRRLCLALTIAQAATLLATPDAKEVEAKQLFSAIYGIVPMGDKDHVVWFTEACEQVIDGFQRSITEGKQIKDLEDFLEMYTQNLEETPSKEDAQILFEDVKRVYAGIQNMPNDQRPNRVALQERLVAVNEGLSQLLQKISDYIVSK